MALGKVGLILGLEASRLARRNSDWYALLDLCALTDTLIGDADGVYDPADYSDRLVLGLKGTIAEAELHLIKGRLIAGLRHKAAKGELRINLPAGYDYAPDGQVVKSPDQAVREAIAAVFDRFFELGSVRQVALSLLDDGLRLPRRRGQGRSEWVRPTYTGVHDLLVNPSYAGVFAYGRRQSARRLGPDGRARTSLVTMPRQQWRVLIHDHHEPYVTWVRHEQILAQVTRNRCLPGQGGGPAREGQALLQGLLRCGRCGRRMHSAYSGQRGRARRYYCDPREGEITGRGECQGLGGRGLDEAVLAEVFRVLEPAAVNATVKALAEAEAAERSRLEVFRTAAEKARYEADRARRQYDACEPENRLVARSLEAAWEAALRAAEQADADLADQQARRPTPLSPDEAALLARAGADLRAVFDAPSTTTRDRKLLLRTLITDVTVTVDTHAGHVDASIGWEGGAVSRARPAAAAPARTHLPGHRRGHRRADPPSRRALRRHHHRRHPRPATPPHRHRAALHPRAGLQRPRRPPHRLLQRNCPTRLRECAHARSPPDRRRTRGIRRDRLPLAHRRVHHRRQTHPRRALAHPHRRRTPRQDHRGHPGRVATARPSRPRPRRGPPDRVASRPTRPARRRPRPPGQAKRPTNQRHQRSNWTVRLARLEGDAVPTEHVAVAPGAGARLVRAGGVVLDDILAEVGQLVRAVDLPVGGGGVDEHDVQVQVEQVRDRGEDLRGDLLERVEQEVHAPVGLIVAQRRQPRDGHILGHPPAAGQLRAGFQGALGDHREHHPLGQLGVQPAAGRSRAQRRPDAQPLPQSVQRPRPAQPARVEDLHVAAPEAAATASAGSRNREIDDTSLPSAARSTVSARPKLWITFAVDAPVSGCRSLCASCRYRTTDPSRFVRRVSRRYMPTSQAARAAAVERHAQNRVPTGFRVLRHDTPANTGPATPIKPESAYQLRKSGQTYRGAPRLKSRAGS